MNSVSRTSLDWHHYKSAGHPCSLACLIMICSLLDVTQKEHDWWNGFFCCLESNLSLHSNVEYTDNVHSVQQNFWRENNKGLLFTMSWSGQLCSCSCSHLSKEMLPLQWSEADWGSSPPPHHTSSSQHKCIWRQNPPRRGGWFLKLASLRYGFQASILLKKFLEKSINF